MQIGRANIKNWLMNMVLEEKKKKKKNFKKI
jgi:hypothetical protein